MSIFLTLIDINICRLKTEMKQNSCLKLCCSGAVTVPSSEWRGTIAKLFQLCCILILSILGFPERKIQKKIHHLHLIFQRRIISDVRANYLVTFRTNFGLTDDAADLCSVSCRLRNIGQNTDCPNGHYLCLSLGSPNKSTDIALN